MKTLDLHGEKHNRVSEIVENFIFENKAPLSIVTGNSNRMKQIVTDILDKNNFKYIIWSKNLGEIVILD